MNPAALRRVPEPVIGQQRVIRGEVLQRDMLQRAERAAVDDLRGELVQRMEAQDVINRELDSRLALPG